MVCVMGGYECGRILLGCRHRLMMRRGVCGVIVLRGRATQVLCRKPECRVKYRAEYFQRYLKTPVGQRVRKRQLAQMKKKRFLMSAGA